MLEEKKTDKKKAKVGKRGVWLGPARLLFRDKHGWWCTHRGVPLLVGQKQLRKATLTEEEAWEILRDAAMSPVWMPEQRGYKDLRAEDPPDTPEDGVEVEDEDIVMEQGAPVGFPSHLEETTNQEAVQEEVNTEQETSAVVMKDETEEENVKEPEVAEDVPNVQEAGHDIVQEANDVPDAEMPQEQDRGQKRTHDEIEERQDLPQIEENTPEEIHAPAPVVEPTAIQPDQDSKYGPVRRRRTRSGLSVRARAIRFMEIRIVDDDKEPDVRVCGVYLSQVKKEVAKNKKLKKAKELSMKEIKERGWEKLFEESDAAEWAAFMKLGVLKKVPSHIADKVRSEAIEMRPVRTNKNESKHKAGEDVQCHAKSGFVARGFQERNLHQFRSDSPTVGTNTANGFVACCARLKLALHSLDIKNAFLTGDKLQRQVYMVPPKDVKGVDPNDVYQAMHGVYGLGDAARMWWLRLRRLFLSNGFEQALHDPTLFVKRDSEGDIVAVAVVHVDDIMLGIRPGSLEKEVIDMLQKNFTIGKHRKGQDGWFEFCGKEYRQLSDYTIQTRMKTYTNAMNCVVILRLRRNQKESPLSAKEYVQLRSLLGQLQWCSRMGVFEISSGVSCLAMSVADPKVQDLMFANLLVQRARKLADKIKVYPSGILIEDFCFVVASDASWANLPGDKSGRGYVLGIFPV